MKKDKVEITEEGIEICEKCGTAKVEEEGFWYCPHCEGEINYLGEDDE